MRTGVEPVAAQVSLLCATVKLMWLQLRETSEEGCTDGSQTFLNLTLALRHPQGSASSTNSGTGPDRDKRTAAVESGFDVRQLLVEVLTAILLLVARMSLKGEKIGVGHPWGSLVPALAVPKRLYSCRIVASGA